MKLEAPKRRSCDRIAATSGCAGDCARPSSLLADPDSDPTAALLLLIDPARLTAANLLSLTGASGSGEDATTDFRAADFTTTP